LDWYKRINRRGGEPQSISSTTASDSAAKTAAAKPATASVPQNKPQAKAEPITYAVQVGAFKSEHELELRAEELRKKGFECRIEPPQTPGQFYLLKVGRFHSRADAVAMLLRLKKGGFPGFIKTN
jgi:cell division septation protein DedD